MIDLLPRWFFRGLARASGCIGLLAALFGFSAAVNATPTGPQVVSGSATTTQAGAVLTVQSSASAILNWQKFSIAANETVHFIQPSASSVVLNRVDRADPAAIYGQLISNGKVWLVNPAGIMVGPCGRVDTAALIGTQDFAAGGWSVSELSGTHDCAASSGTSEVTAAPASAGFDALLLKQGDQTHTAIPLNPGWNLVGNGGSTGFDVDTLFGDAAKVVSVWKWVAASSRWALYSPTLTPEELAAYAQRGGYDVLARVEAGEGIWVNAGQAFLAVLPEGAALSAATLRAKLVTGWNLVSVGERQTPAELNAALGTVSGADAATPPAPGDVKSIWAWDNQRAKWYFHAPDLDKRGTLAAYVAGKSYIDFAATSKTLGPGVGFWVNKADKIPLTITATGIGKVYDGTTTAQVSFSDNRVAGDILEIAAASTNFLDQHVGTGKAITVTGITVTGLDAGKYTFNTTATASADITQATLSITVPNLPKVYDGYADIVVSKGIDLTSVRKTYDGTVSTAMAGTLSSNGGSNAANYYAVASASAGAGTLTITASPLTLTSSGANQPTVTATGAQP